MFTPMSGKRIAAWVAAVLVAPLAVHAAPLPAGWVDTNLTGLHIALPGTAKVETLPAPEAIKERLKVDGVLQAQVTTPQCFASVMLTQYKEAANLPGTLGGVVASYKGNPKVTEFSSKAQEVRIQGRPAMYAEFSYNFSGKPTEQRWLVVAEGSKSWQVSLVTKAGTIDNAWKLMVDSIRIERVAAP